MSDVVERQDVDISKLFGWGMVYEIVDPNDSETVIPVYMKLLGDADLGRARVYALRKSSDMRRKLKDLNSDERLAWIRDFDEVEVPDLVNLILLFSGRDMSNNAKAKVKIPTPKPPKTNAKLEKLEQFQKEVDEYPEKRASLIKEAVEKEIEKTRLELQSKPKEDLYKQYVRLVIEEFCEREAFTAFEDMQVYLGCFKDDTYKADRRFFSSFEEFDNLEPTVKSQFKDAYRSLDIELSELKKLRRATP